VKKKIGVSIVVDLSRDRSISPSYLSLKNLTIREERVVKIPNPKIPIWKLEWSAITPKRKGITPPPKIIPIEMITPVAIARSDRGVSFEMVDIPMGKKARERVACRIRAVTIIGRVEARERPMVLSPVMLIPSTSIFRYP
jgi:hypothetical protein